MKSEDRINQMDSKVDGLKSLYIKAGCYVNEYADEKKEEIPFSDVEFPEEDAEEPEAVEGEEEDEEDDTTRYYYFGGLLYPTKNERHYRIYKMIRQLGVSYAMAFHYEEFHDSIKKIAKDCFDKTVFYSDILQMKSRNEKFVSLKNGKEIRLIEPHVHFLLRWDNKISARSFCKFLGLERNLVKFRAKDGKFLKKEYNPLNYLCHAGRSFYKFSKRDFRDLNTIYEDDIQDRATYSVDDVDACPKWYKMLLTQVEAFGDVRRLLFNDFANFLLGSHHFVTRLAVVEWFAKNELYNDLYMSDKWKIRSDVLSIVYEHNLDYKKDKKGV